MADVAGRAARLLADEGGEVEMRPAHLQLRAERIQPDDATGVNRSLSSPKLPNRLWSLRNRPQATESLSVSMFSGILLANAKLGRWQWNKKTGGIG